MLIFDKDVLAEHGLELSQTENGFQIQGTEHVSQEVLDALGHASRELHLADGDFESLVEFAIGLGLWASMREASKRSSPGRPIGRKESKKAKRTL